MQFFCPYLTIQQINELTHSNALAALRAVFKIRIERLAATFALAGRVGLRLRIIRTQSAAGLHAAVTQNKGFAFFYSEYGDKKQAEIVVHALRIGLIQSAHRAPARILVQYLFFGRYTGNEDHLQTCLEYWSNA